MLSIEATKRILQVGVGGVGGPIAQHLGLVAERLTLVDGDVYEPKNCSRQPFAIGNEDEPKVHVVEDSIKGGKAEVDSIFDYITDENIEEILEETNPTLVVLCVDKDEPRKLFFSRNDRFPILWAANELWDPQAGLCTPDWRWDPMEYFVKADGEVDPNAEEGCGEQTISANIAAASMATQLLHTHIAPQERENAKTGNIPLFMARAGGGIFLIQAREMANMGTDAGS